MFYEWLERHIVTVSCSGVLILVIAVSLIAITIKEWRNKK